MTEMPGSAGRRPRATLEEEAAIFARGDLAAMEQRLIRFADEAIASWRLEEAIFWQRVRFRARLIRATGSRAAPVGAGGKK